MSWVKTSEPPPRPHPVIAVDGHSSCGKSTFARMIAAELEFVYIDSGAMYRAVALYCLQNGLVSDGIPDKAGLLPLLPAIDMRFSRDEHGGNQNTWLNGQNVEQEIRGLEVSSVVSRISQIAEVRTLLVSLQRNLAVCCPVVMDGRDIGTVVFPNATLKIFMTADPAVRAMRRYHELTLKGLQVDLSEIEENIRMRDFEDENRAESPLRRSPDALLLDNSHMTPEEQMDWFRKIWQLKSTSHAH